MLPYQTFASRKARKTRRYEWGDMAPAIRQTIGRLVDSQPGKGGNPLENLLHRVDVPIAGARLELRQPFMGTVYTTISDANGYFAFDQVPEGTYALHIEAGTASGDRTVDSTDLLIQLSITAKQGTLLLARREAGAGSCGGTSIEIKHSPNSWQFLWNSKCASGQERADWKLTRGSTKRSLAN